jgi:hypothetical protein
VEGFRLLSALCRFPTRFAVGVFDTYIIVMVGSFREVELCRQLVFTFKLSEYDAEESSSRRV